MIELIVIWLLGLFLIGIIVGAPSLLCQDLETLIEIGFPSAITWTVICWTVSMFIFVAEVLG